MKLEVYLFALLLLILALTQNAVLAQAEGDCPQGEVLCDSGDCQESCKDDGEHDRRRRNVEQTVSSYSTGATMMTSTLTECVFSGMTTYSTGHTSSLMTSYSAGQTMTVTTSIECTMPPTTSYPSTTASSTAMTTSTMSTHSSMMSTTSTAMSTSTMTSSSSMMSTPSTAMSTNTMTSSSSMMSTTSAAMSTSTMTSSSMMSTNSAAMSTSTMTSSSIMSTNSAAMSTSTMTSSSMMSTSSAAMSTSTMTTPSSSMSTSSAAITTMPANSASISPTASTVTVPSTATESSSQAASTGSTSSVAASATGSTSAQASSAMASSSSVAPTSSITTTTFTPARTQNQNFEIKVAGSLSTFLANTTMENATQHVKTQIASQLSINESRITNVRLSEGSIIVAFEIIPASSASQETIAALESILRNSVLGGNLTLTDPSGNPLTIDTTYFITNVVADDEPESRRDLVPIIVGCVVGVFCLIVIFIVIIVIVLKKKQPTKHNSFVSPSSSNGQTQSPYGNGANDTLPAKPGTDGNGYQQSSENDRAPGTSSRPGSQTQQGSNV